MPKPLSFYRQAIKEARRAFRWYARRSPQAATRFRMSLTQALEAIQANPRRWPQYLAGTRVVRLRPYLVIFRESPIETEIVAVAHGHRRPGYWKRRACR